MTEPIFHDDEPSRSADESDVAEWWGPRPGAASTGAVLLIVFGALAIVFSLYVIGQLGSEESDYGLSPDPVEYLIWWGQILFSATQIVAGLFLWRGFDWARVTGIACCSLNLLAGVISLFGGSVLPAFVAFAINGGIIAALTRPEVREWCQSAK